MPESLYGCVEVAACSIAGEATKVGASQNVAEVSSYPNCSKEHFHIALWLADAQLAYRTLLEFLVSFGYPNTFDIQACRV